jgi:hypothetical protein
MTPWRGDAAMIDISGIEFGVDDSRRCAERRRFGVQ